MTGSLRLDPLRQIDDDDARGFHGFGRPVTTGAKEHQQEQTGPEAGPHHRSLSLVLTDAAHRNAMARSAPITAITPGCPASASTR